MGHVGWKKGSPSSPVFSPCVILVALSYWHSGLPANPTEYPTTYPTSPTFSVLTSPAALTRTPPRLLGPLGHRRPRSFYSSPPTPRGGSYWRLGRIRLARRAPHPMPPLCELIGRPVSMQACLRFHRQGTQPLWFWFNL